MTSLRRLSTCGTDISQSSIASLSAVITILALAAEPFTQQVLRYPTKQLKAANVTSAIGVTNALYPIEPNVDEGTKSKSISNPTLSNL